MLDILLVVLALVVTGACVGRWRLRFAARGGVVDQVVGMIQQAYAAQGFRVGGPPGGTCGCRPFAIVAALAGPAPQRRPASLDGWSSEHRGPR